MFQKLSLFWRYFLTGFICILLSSVLTYLVISVAEEQDNQRTFKEETKEVLSNIETAAISQSLNQILQHPDIPFDIKIENQNKAQNTLNQIIELSENHYQISYYSQSLQKVLTLSDKVEFEYEYDDDDHYDNLISLVERMVWILAIITLLASGFYIISKQIYKHIQQLVHASEKISLGEFSTHIPTDSPEPIRQIAKQLNKTRDNIQHLIQKEKILAYAIPHELRTPVSKIRLALDLSRKNKTVADYQLLIEDLDNYTDELEGLITQLMDLAQSEAKLTYTEIALTEELTTLKEEYSRQFPNKSIVLESDVKTIVSSKAKLSLILNNLMQNAANYSDRQIHILVTEDKENTTIIFSNDGEKIPENEMSNIFDPFYRLEKSRNRKTGGAGIGLALVKQAVNQLGGVIEINQDSKLGTIFKVTLVKIDSQKIQKL